MRLLFSVALVLSTSATSTFAQVPSDFDEDGVSDVLSTSASGTSIRWQTVPSGDGTAISTEFGKAGDVLIPGYWLSSTLSSLAVVSPDTTNNRLNWRALLDDGTVSKRSLGAPGDYVIAGADFNGDGIADAATMRQTGGKFRWSTVLSHLAQSPGKTRQFSFGSDGQRVFFLSLDGVKDSLGVFGLEKNRRTATLVTRDITSKKQRRFGRFPAKLAKGVRPRPLPIQNPEGVDDLAFVTADDTDTTIEVYSIKAELLDRVVLPGVGAVAVGEYDASLPGEELVLQSGSSSRYVNPFEKTREVGESITGTLLDPIEVAQTIAPTPVATPAVTPTVTATGGVRP
jgi:hypothetical protein